MDAAAFRSALGHFCSGVVVVTGADGGVPAGLTCQSFLSLSLDPPLVGFSPARTSASYPAIRRSGAFCVNILAEDQQDLCAGFARTRVDKWAGVGWRAGPTGSPILDGALAWIDCALDEEHPAGDHFLVVGRVLAAAATEARPLLFFRSAFHGLADRPAA